MLGRRNFLTLGAAATVTVAAAPKFSLANAGSRRSLRIHAPHFTETLNVEYFVDGWYNPDALAQVNHLFRDRRSGDVREIDPNLLDMLYVIQQRAGGGEPIHMISGYRSAATNSRIAASNRGVARNSYHMYGRAADIRIPGVQLSGVRSIALDMNSGGVGYYPRSNFVHVDTGAVRQW